MHKIGGLISRLASHQNRTARVKAVPFKEVLSMQMGKEKPRTPCLNLHNIIISRFQLHFTAVFQCLLIFFIDPPFGIVHLFCHLAHGEDAGVKEIQSQYLAMHRIRQIFSMVPQIQDSDIVLYNT